MEGNELLRNEKVEEAIEKYTKAIELDPSNQVFYCNRAAAFSKMNNHYAAIEDCKRAIDMNPSYGKAYGRMGLAYSSVEKHKEAVDCFQKALALEPENESYKTNLLMAQEKLSSAGSPGAAPGGMFAGLANPAGGPGAPDLVGLLNNPALMNLANSMLSNPEMQNMMLQVMNAGGNASSWRSSVSWSRLGSRWNGKSTTSRSEVSRANESKQSRISGTNP